MILAAQCYCYLKIQEFFIQKERKGNTYGLPTELRGDVGFQSDETVLYDNDAECSGTMDITI